MGGGAEERRESLAESRMGQQETNCEEHPRMMHRKAYTGRILWTERRSRSRTKACGITLKTITSHQQTDPKNIHSGKINITSRDRPMRRRLEELESLTVRERKVIAGSQEIQMFTSV